MTKTMKRVLLGICSCLLLLLCVNVFTGMQTKKAKAATSHTQLTTETVAILEQASVRITDIDDPYKGIRFTAAVNASYLADLGEGATVGIIVKKGASDTLIEMGDSGVFQFESGVWFDENVNGMKYFTAVVYGIPAEDSGVSITARAYAMSKDGTTTDYSETQSVRSMAYVADKALHDGYEEYANYLIPYVDNAITSFTLSESEVTVYVDSETENTYTLAPVLEGQESRLTVTYQSADENICTVDANGKITAVSYGSTTVTATCGSKTATAQVNVSVKADRSMISNAEIVNVEEHLNAAYTFDENKLAEGAEAGINVTFDAQKLTGFSKDVLLQTNLNLIADTEYVFEYSVKVNDEKWGGFDSGFGYRTLVNLVDADGEYIATDGKTADQQNIIAMSRYTAQDNQEYYRCSVRYTPSMDMENVRFVIRIAAADYTKAVDITLYKFKCFEAADTLGAKIVGLSDNTGTMVAEQTADATLLAELNAGTGILLKNDKAVVPAPEGTSGPMFQFNQALKGGKTYTVLYDVKKVAVDGEGASEFDAGNFFHTRFSVSNTTTVNNFTENAPIASYGKGNNADKETINGYDIYHCANTFTATEDVPNLHMKINLYSEKTVSYKVVITNFRVVENDWATQVGDIYTLFSTNSTGSHTQITDDKDLLAGLNTNVGIRVYNETNVKQDGQRGFRYKFNTKLKADTEYKIYFDVKNVSNSLGNTTDQHGGAYNFEFSTNGTDKWSKQRSVKRVSPFVSAAETIANDQTVYHCVHTITTIAEMNSLIMRFVPYGTMSFDVIIANVVVVESDNFAISAYETYYSANGTKFHVTQDSDKLVNEAAMGLEWHAADTFWATFGTGKTLEAGTYTLSYEVISLAGEEDPLFLGAYNTRVTSKQPNTTGGTKTVTDVTPEGSAYKVFNVEVEFTFEASAQLYLQAYNVTGEATGGFVITNLAVDRVVAAE